MKIPTIKITRATIVLVVALAVGGIAALTARNYLNGQMAALEAQTRGNHVNVVVAKRELKRGDVLNSESVAVRSVPADFAHSNALQPNEFDRFDGHVLAFSAKAGEMVLWSMLESKKAPTFSARLDAGHRAITVPVDEINSISGLLEPGDLVDLMVTLDQKGKKFTIPFLQTIRVLATGQRAADDPKSGEKRQYTTVTLDATPEQAENVIVAREAGKITALLRNPNDKQHPYPVIKSLAALLGSQAFGDSLLGIRQVPVIYGGRGSKVPPEGTMLGQYVYAPANPVPPNLAQKPSSAGTRLGDTSEADADAVVTPPPLSTPV